jgi:hypothetical protein
MANIEIDGMIDSQIWNRVFHVICMYLLSPSMMSGLTRQSVCHRMLNGTVILKRMIVCRRSSSRPSLQSSTVTHVQPPILQFQRTTSTEENGPPFSDKSFRLIGLEPNLVQALRKAFPNIKRPTKVQESLVTEILGGRDILLKDRTGSGK